MIYITSDTHFDHERIIELCKRPFKNVEEMNEGLIKNWNDTVKPEDFVVNLGDVCFGTLERYKEIYSRLNGSQLILRGNHDKSLQGLDELVLNSGKRIKIKDYHELKKPAPGVNDIVLSHYPLLHWNKSFWGTYMIHGHRHGKSDSENVGTRRKDAGVDPNNYRPISVVEIHEMLKDNAVKKFSED